MQWDLSPGWHCPSYVNLHLCEFTSDSWELRRPVVVMILCLVKSDMHNWNPQHLLWYGWTHRFLCHFLSPPYPGSRQSWDIISGHMRLRYHRVVFISGSLSSQWALSLLGNSSGHSLQLENWGSRRKQPGKFCGFFFFCPLFFLMWPHTFYSSLFSIPGQSPFIYVK